MTTQAVKAQSPRNKIISLLLEMGLKVDQAVAQAITALLRSDTHQQPGLLANAVAIQELEVALDGVVFDALESGELPASEVRQASAVININKDLARLGKLAANLGRKVSQVGEHRQHEDLSRLQPLAIAVSHLCRQTLQSLIRMDLVLATNAAAGSSSVDAYRDYVVRGSRDSGSPLNDEQSVHLIFASRCLEQIADYTIDLSENLVTFLESEPCPQPELAIRQHMAC